MWLLTGPAEEGLQFAFLQSYRGLYMQRQKHNRRKGSQETSGTNSDNFSLEVRLRERVLVVFGVGKGFRRNCLPI